MAKLKVGDRIDCCIKLNSIVNPYDEYDEIRTFEIIATDSYGYFIYIPQYILIKGASKVDKLTCKSLGVSSKFAGENMIYIKEGLVHKISSVFDGMKCIKCSEFYHMAGPNQEEGKFLCWSCKTYPYH